MVFRLGLGEVELVMRILYLRADAPATDRTFTCSRLKGSSGSTAAYCTAQIDCLLKVVALGLIAVVPGSPG